MDLKSFEQLLKIAKTLALRPEERAQMREALLAFIKTHPVKQPELARQAYQKPSFWSTLSFRSLITKPMPIAIMVALLLTTGAGVSYAAEGALPGNNLYPVKVGFNEEVRSLLTLSPQAKAQWEIRRAERRLTEAEKLAAAGKLDANLLTQIQTNFERHTERVKNRIAEFKSQENLEAEAELNSNLETSLETHQQILSRLEQNETDSSKSEIHELIQEVKFRAQNASDDRVKTEDKITSQDQKPAVRAAAEGKLIAAQNKITEVTNYLQTVKASLNTQAVGNAEARIAAANNLVTKGQARLTAGDYAQAFRLFAEAQRTAQEAKLILEIRASINLGDEDIHVNATTTQELEDNRGHATSTEDLERDRHGGDQEKTPIQVELNF